MKKGLGGGPTNVEGNSWNYDQIQPKTEDGAWKTTMEGILTFEGVGC